jgi:hypothetical protein
LPGRPKCFTIDRYTVSYLFVSAKGTSPHFTDKPTSEELIGNDPVSSQLFVSYAETCCS